MNNIKAILLNGIWYDIESSIQSTLNSNQLANIINIFHKDVKAQGYNTIGVYANKYWLENIIDTTLLPDNCPIWLAHYTGATQTDPLLNPSTYEGTYIMWQYINTGRLDGINGNIDCNIGFKKVK